MKRRGPAAPAPADGDGDDQGMWDLQDTIRLTAGASGEGVQVRRIHPSQARKLYICPGCQHEILSGVGHVVVVPLEARDLRRHWHTSCWMMRDRRRPGR